MQWLENLFVCKAASRLSRFKAATYRRAVIEKTKALRRSLNLPDDVRLK